MVQTHMYRLKERTNFHDFFFKFQNSQMLRVFMYFLYEFLADIIQSFKFSFVSMKKWSVTPPHYTSAENTQDKLTKMHTNIKYNHSQFVCDRHWFCVTLYIASHLLILTFWLAQCLQAGKHLISNPGIQFCRARNCSHMDWG